MARFAVIGLGRFGAHVVRSLHERGHEVVAIDRDDARVKELRDTCSRPIVADCTDRDTIANLGIEDCDAVVLSLGDRMDASILTALYLKELGVKRVVAKALSPDHALILERMGITEVVHPERDTALRLARRLATRSLVEYLPLAPGFSLMEVATPRKYQGKTLGDLDIRRRFQVSVVAVKNGEKMEPVPGADYAVKEGDVLVLVGRDSDLERLANVHD